MEITQATRDRLSARTLRDLEHSISSLSHDCTDALSALADQDWVGLLAILTDMRDAVKESGMAAIGMALESGVIPAEAIGAMLGIDGSGNDPAETPSAAYL